MVKRRVFAWITDTAACLHYRIVLPLTHLSSERFDVSWGAPPPDIHDYDVVIGQRLAGPNVGWENLCRDPDIMTVYDIDDDLLNVDPANTIPYQVYAPLVADTQRNIALADVVTCSTPNLANLLRTINPNVVVLPNCITPDVVQRPIQSMHNPFVIGWAGSMFHAQDWPGMPEILATIRSIAPHVSVHTVGADYTGGVSSHNIGFVPIPHLYDALRFSVGIAPLLRSTFNESKSWIKVLEYAAVGIPAVTTAWGQYPEWVEHGVNGFIVHNDRHWVDFLLALTDPAVHARMSAAARAKAAQYTIDRLAYLWANVYEGALWKS